MPKPPSSATLSQPPFRPLLWSVGILLAFLFLQAIVSIALALIGLGMHPAMGFFTWFAVCGSVGFGIYRRCRPERVHMLVLQGFACLYMVAISLAVIYRSSGAIDAGSLMRSLGVVFGLFIAGSLGFVLAAKVRSRLST